MTDAYKDIRHALEARWQAHWQQHRITATPNPGEPGFDPARPKAVVLDMFPYPSGVGLHIGHPLGYIATDVYSRFLRMRGHNVLHSMGFDAFGLPAEQFAIQTGQHPRITTEQNIANMLSQLARLGLDHDPERRFATTDPDYIRWTQWIFLQLYNSFFDPTETWTDRLGRQVQGRARPIAELAARLDDGRWRLDGDGRPVPASDPAARPARVLEGAERHRALAAARLAYLAEVPVNWCPMLGTVLANEEVTADGRSERGDYPVYRRTLAQWMLRITVYADRLYSDLELVDWPDGIIEMQRNWIGPSTGAEVTFAVADSDATITVYTTRPDTLFGVSSMALAVDHPLVARLTDPARRAEVEAYCRQTAQETARQQLGDKADDKTKTGIFIGAYAINPVNGARVPIFAANYVLMDYGTGAVMGVPAHDQRDFDFARSYDLAIVPVVMPDGDWLVAEAREPGPPEVLAARYRHDPGAFRSAFTGRGVVIHSASDRVSLDGLGLDEAKARIIAWLEASGHGRGQTSYKLRDWLFSRQRFWGEPIPVVFDEATGLSWPVALDQLPVELPEMEDFAPTAVEDPDAPPTPPLSRAREWIAVRGDLDSQGFARLSADGPRQFRRELNTMPNWAGSCWYYLRYFDARNDRAMVDPAVEAYWSGTAAGQPAAGAVDLYMGGAEHAVLHLLYARFWHKVLFDLGHVSTPEPFARLINQGMITADAFRDERGVYVDIRDVEIREEKRVTADGREVTVEVGYEAGTGRRLITEPGKMGKRYKNGIPPEEICDQYSADVLRLYEMYMGPIEASKPWRGNDIVGMMRFVERVWRTAMRALEAAPDAGDEDQAALRLRHRTIAKVTEDLSRLRMNTAIAALIEWVNAMPGDRPVARATVETLALLMAPLTPHLADELWLRLDPARHAAQRSVALAPWPAHDPALAAADQRQIVVQVNGKKRGEFLAPLDADASRLEADAAALEAVARALEGQTVRRVLVVPPNDPRIVNFVIG